MNYLFDIFRTPLQEVPGKDLDNLQEKVKEIIYRIDGDLFNTKNKVQAEFYIGKIETAILNHQKNLTEYLELNMKKGTDKIIQTYLTALENIRKHIEINYSMYRDPAKPVSRATLDVLSMDLTKNRKLIIKLLEQNEINDKLINIILYPINQIINRSEKEVSQQRINYLNHFTKELIHFLESLGMVEEKQVLHYLYVLNFNSIALLTYICEDYQQMKKEIEDDRDILDFLEETKIQINHIPVSQGPPFDVNLNDLKHQVLFWIEEELRNVKKAIKQKQKEAEEPEQTRLELSLSVENLTTFFRLLYDTGFIKSGANHTVRWIATALSSKNQLQISQQSIQRKFYEKHVNKEPIKEIVIGLLNELNRKT